MKTTMRKSMSLLTCVLVAATLTGCTTFSGNKSVPISKYKDPDRSFEIGKDMHFKKFDMHKGFVDKAGFTNFTHIIIDGLESTNSPAVIDSGGVANANSIIAGGQVFQQGMQFGAQVFKDMLAMYAQANGIPVGGGSAQPAQPPRPVSIARPTVRWPDQLGAVVKVDGRDYKLQEVGTLPTGEKVRIFIDDNGQRFAPSADGKMLGLTSNSPSP